MTSNQILLRAANIIDERGHCQGRMEDEQGRCCGLQAMIYAAGGERTPDVDEAYLAWCRQTGYEHDVSNYYARGASTCCTESYNDTHSAAEVTASLRAAATIDVEHERMVAELDCLF